MTEPSLSVIVPMFNAPENLARCLAGLAASTVADFELIVVDDASSDERARALAAASGARVLRLEANAGPGVARNAGAASARGDVLVFVDSDVVVHAETLARMRACLAERGDAAGLFGSYDAEPAAPGVVSAYRNLLHHWTHQNGPPEASTFWAGCGALRREVFLRHGGFDPFYRRPSIEDIELGMRLVAAGERILLRPEIQCTHLKRWRLAEMVRVDVACRAIPWTHLLIERPGTGGDLNLELGQKLCVVLVLAALALPALGALLGWAVAGLALSLAALGVVAWINRGLYALFWRRRGAGFACAGFLLHALYYVYSAGAFAWAHLAHGQWARRARERRAGFAAASRSS